MSNRLLSCNYLVMRFNKLDLNLLVALDAMLHTCNVTQAANQLHMSQSAMSNCLARLRDYFGDALLVQVGRNMELTPRGEMLKDAVRDLLLRAETTISVQPEFDPESSLRQFRIAISDYSTAVLIPHLLRRTNQAAPGVSIQLIPQFGDAARALERGEADLLIIPAGYCSTEHPSEVLFEESYTCVVWSKSRWAREGINREQYADARHVVMQPSGTDRPALGEAQIREAGIERKVAVFTYSFLSESELVVGGDLVATVHSRLARRAKATLPVSLIRPPIELPVMQQSVQWHKHRTGDPGLAWLLAQVREAAAGMDDSV